MGRLEGKVAVVTGGGNGIGRACCVRFAEEGADVVVADLQDGPGEETAEAVRAKGRHAVYVHAEATSPGDNTEVARRAALELGGLDVLVTAAGISHAGYVSGDTTGMLERVAERATADQARLFADMSLDEWQPVLDVNLTGTLLAMQAAAGVMLDHGRGGSIVTIASIAAKRPEAGPAAYAVSKAGVWMLTKHAARSLGPAGIRVNAICPGLIRTPLTEQYFAAAEFEEGLGTVVPQGRVGTAADVADAALYLASDQSAYVTGVALTVDGGWLAEKGFASGEAAAATFLAASETTGTG
jgi:NAD(P)-dependent dehydrogenase (short-subunit alcohol dehydrogenase family)